MGYRRPVMVEPLFLERHVAAHPSSPRRRLVADVTVPEGLDQPRIQIVTSGHATDGQGGNEFVTCPHVLKVDGREVAMWRPWAEGGGALAVGGFGRVILGQGFLAVMKEQVFLAKNIDQFVEQVSIDADTPVLTEIEQPSLAIGAGITDSYDHLASGVFRQ